MIKINLASRKQVEVGGDSKNNVLGIEIDFEQLKQLPIGKVVVPIVIGFVANYVLESYKQGELDKLSTVAQKLTEDGTRWQTELEKFKKYDEVKKQLDSDEVAIRHKLETIQKLMGSRSDAGQLVISISNSMPPGVWLTNFKYSDTSLEIKGGSSEYNQISDFMKSLNESTLLANVELKGSEHVKETEAGSDYEGFELTAQRR